MKIGINALFFQYPATGSGQYMLHLLAALGAFSRVVVGAHFLTDVLAGAALGTACARASVSAWQRLRA